MSEDAETEDWGESFMLAKRDERSGRIHFCAGVCAFKSDARTMHAKKWFVEPTRDQIGITEAEVEIPSE